jgi:FkbM family methyltransferase
MPNVLTKIKSRIGGHFGIPEPLAAPSPIIRRVKADAPICVLDLGAHKGGFTRSILTHYRISRGVLVEPLPHLAEQLRRDFQEPQYQVFECAVSDKDGVADFEKTEYESSSSLLAIKRELPELADIPLNGAHLQVKVRNVDGICREAGIDKLDILKIDVQGVEDKTLAGASETLKRTEAIWIEVSFKPLYEGSPTFWDIYNQLDKSFRMVEMQPAFRGVDSELLQSDVLFLSR